MARRALRSPIELDFNTDITGSPNAAPYREFKRDQRRGLEGASHSPFFYRVNTERTIWGKTERVQVLISKSRDMGGMLYGDDWEVVGWTSPIANLIQGVRPGGKVELVRTGTTVYRAHESARYEELLPRVANASFMLWNGDATMADEEMLGDSAIPAAIAAEPKPREYEATETFGLSDIIVLADEPQRAAMALPFDRSVMIEGPPGSGKTSIGIMRVAVLYDQQWEAMRLRQDRDTPFHTYESMRILVHNEEMVDYLKSLAQSIGVERARVETTEDFFRRVCRATGLLRGTRRRDPVSLTAIKGRREVLWPCFAGLQRHLHDWWERHAPNLRRRLGEIAPDYAALADCTGKWVERISRAKFVDGGIVGSTRLVDDLSECYADVIAGRSPTRRAAGRPGRDSLQSASREAKRIMEESIRLMCDRANATRTMFSLPEYRRFLNTLADGGLPKKTIEVGDRQWREQYEAEAPSFSPIDLAIWTWLGAPMLLSARPDRKPWIGGPCQRLTHLVIDEAQDLSPSHIAILGSQLVANGTLTLVGDLHQNLNPHAGLRRWEDANIRAAMRTAFGVNHRQTQQLGNFVRGAHSALFDEPCPWKSSNRFVGEIPRARQVTSWRRLSSAIALEVGHWRDLISGATVAVLYDGILTPQRLRLLQSSLERQLSDQLVPVDAVLPGKGSDVLKRTDRVLIASVKQTKGLEFDAVVYIEASSRWSKPLADVEVRDRNGFYVAISRARAGLSLCMRTIPSFVRELSARGLCEVLARSTEQED